MSWLINTHTEFCNGIHRASCVEPRDGKGKLLLSHKLQNVVCFAKFQEWWLPKFVQAVGRHALWQELAWVTKNPFSKVIGYLASLSPASFL